jgi:CDP-diacylglycerol--serine O-phosphatidyltransferase
VLLYTLAIALLMVSKVPTFSGKLIGQRIPREYVPPLFVAAALFMALLLTYPYLTLTVGSLLYLAMIPVSAYRYFAQERKAAAVAKAQAGKGSHPDHDAEVDAKVVEMGAKSRSTGKGLNAKS